MNDETKSILKKILVVFVIVFVIFVLINLFLFIKNYKLKDSKIEFLYPSIYTRDVNGNNYVIDNSSKRVVKTDKYNKLVYIIEGGLKDNKHFYNANDISVDYSGNLYLLESQSDENGFYVNKVSLKKFDNKGKFVSLIYEKEFKQEELKNVNVQRTLFKNLKIVNNNLYFYQLTDDGIIEFIYNDDIKKLRNRKLLNIEKANVVISNINIINENLYSWTTKKGEIYIGNSDYSKKIFDNENFLPLAIKNVENEIIFSDLINKNLYKINIDNKDNQKPEEIIKNSYNKYEFNLLNYYYNIKTTKNSFCLTAENFIIEIDKNGKVNFIENYFNNNYLNILIYYLAIFLFFIFIIGLIVSFYFFYTIFLEKKFSIILKQIVIYTPILVISIALTSLLVYNDLINRYEILLNNNISMMIQMISKTIDSDEINNLNTPKDFMSPVYINLKNKITNLLNNNQDPWNSGFYFAIHKKINDYIYSIMFLNDDITVKYPFDYLNEANSIYIKSYEGNILIEKSIDQWGNWFYGVGPIYDKNNNIIGLLEIGKDNTAFERQNRKLIGKIIRNILILTFVMIVVLFIVSYYLLLSLKKLKEGTKLIEKGMWDVRLKVSGKDEIADLTNSFNNMTSYIDGFLNEITNLNKIYFKFVPEEFIKFLNKKSITDIKLGDQIQEEMTIMFSDIVGFTNISEKLTPKENFNFLNSYLSLVGPTVRKNHGFIDKYIGDAIMALYPRYADDAIETAISIRKILVDFNIKQKEANLPEIDVCFGIHTGMLMLGILGEEQRVDSTVISDNVNLASRLEGLTRKFGSTIIISGDTYNKIINKSLYIFRYLGKVRVKGKENDVKIFDILDGFKNEEKAEKIRYLDSFHLAVEYFEKYEYEKALNILNTLYEKCPKDKAIKFYIDICQNYIKNKIKENVIILYDK